MIPRGVWRCQQMSMYVNMCLEVSMQRRLELRCLEVLSDYTRRNIKISSHGSVTDTMKVSVEDVVFTV